MFRWSVLAVFLASLFVTGCGSSNPEPVKVDPEAVKKARDKSMGIEKD